MSLIEKFLPTFFFDYQEKNFPYNYKTNKEENVVVAYKNGNIIQYWLYYNQDGGLGPFDLGSHEFDHEGLVIKINDDGSKIKEIAYRPHGSEEHFKIIGDDVKKCINTDDRPIVYVTIGKHAQYPVCGTIKKYFGIANDTIEKPTERKMTIIEYDFSDEVFNKKINVNDDMSQYKIVKYKDIKDRLIFNTEIPSKWVTKQIKKKF
jgi:hypothetical protein